jgi:signal recognition particle subunit SEC65
MDKSRFEHLVEKRMSKETEPEKFDLTMIVEMMEQLGGLVPLTEAIEEKQNPYQTAFAAQEVGLTADQKKALRAIPKLDMSELGWAEPVGAGADTRISAKRGQLEEIFNDIRASNINQTLQNLKKLLDADLPTATVQQKINSLVAVKTITEMLANFNEKSAGFIFEPFMAALIGPQGRQVATDARILPDIQAGNDYYGLKLLAMRPGYVSGSARDLVNFFVLHPTSKVNYIVAYKGKEDVEIFIAPIDAAEAMKILIQTSVRASSKLPKQYLDTNIKRIVAEYNKLAGTNFKSTSFSALDKKATDKAKLAQAIIAAMPSGKFGKFVLKPGDLAQHSVVKLPLGAKQVAISIQKVLGEIVEKLALIMDAAEKTQQAVFKYAESGLKDELKKPARDSSKNLEQVVSKTQI